MLMSVWQHAHNDNAIMPMLKGYSAISFFLHQAEFTCEKEFYSEKINLSDVDQTDGGLEFHRSIHLEG